MWAAVAAAQTPGPGVAMNTRHTVFAATAEALHTVGMPEPNLHPAIDGLAVDYAIRACLAHATASDAEAANEKKAGHSWCTPKTQAVRDCVRHVTKRAKAKTVHDLLHGSGQDQALLSSAERHRRDRCGASNVIGAKYVSNGTAFVTTADAAVLVSTPMPVDSEFRRCVMSGTDSSEHVRLRLCGADTHCIFGATRGLIAVEKKLHLAGPIPPVHSAHRALRPKWQERVAGRLAFLLALARDQPWRVDTVPGAASPMTVRDAAFLEDAVLTYDAPIRVFTILLNTKDDGLHRDMLSIWEMIKERKLGHQFHYFYEPEGVGVSGAWNRQLQHVLREAPTAKWVWVTQPDVFARGSYCTSAASPGTPPASR